MNKTKLLLLSCASLMLAGPSLATTAYGETIEGGGTVTYIQTAVETSKLANGGTLLQSSTKGVILADDTSTPFHLAGQNCNATIVVSADGASVSNSGACHAVDKEGDVWTLHYSGDMNGSRWEIITGTGKYQNMSGGGTTKVLLNSADGRIVISWQGTMQMK